MTIYVIFGILDSGVNQFITVVFAEEDMEECIEEEYNTGKYVKVLAKQGWCGRDFDDYAYFDGEFHYC